MPTSAVPATVVAPSMVSVTSMVTAAVTTVTAAMATMTAAVTTVAAPVATAAGQCRRGDEQAGCDRSDETEFR
jgi:hypothetical protein